MSMLAWKSSLRRREAVACYLFLAPGLLGFGLFILFPLVYSFGMSFMEYSIKLTPRFVGLANWNTLIHDPLCGSRCASR